MTIANGYASIEKDYDEAGNVIYEAYYDENGQPMLTTKQAVFAVRRVYNDNKKVIRESYYDVNDQPMIIESGYASVEKDYDEAGNVIYEAYYDENGQPMLATKQAVFAVRRVYNEDKRVI